VTFEALTAVKIYGRFSGFVAQSSLVDVSEILQQAGVALLE
jgi:hypothetical protein